MSFSLRVRIGAFREKHLDDADTSFDHGCRRIWPAECIAERVHVDRRVQRRHAFDVSEVQVRALLDESRRGIPMAVDDGDDEGRRALRIGEVEIRPSLGQRACRV